MSGDPSEEYFSDGATDDLISSPTKIHALSVTSRTTVMHYKRTTKALPDIGRELGVDGILEGSVQRSGGRVRITAQLIRVSTDKHLWSNEYDRDMTDVLKLEAEVAQTIAQEIQATVMPEETKHVASAKSIRPEAQEQYRPLSFLESKPGGLEALHSVFRTRHSTPARAFRPSWRD